MKYIKIAWIISLMIIVLTIIHCIISITYIDKYNKLKKEHEQLQTDYATLKINYEDLLIDEVNKLKENNND